MFFLSCYSPFDKFNGSFAVRVFKLNERNMGYSQAAVSLFQQLEFILFNKMSDKMNSLKGDSTFIAMKHIKSTLTPCIACNRNGTHITTLFMSQHNLFYMLLSQKKNGIDATKTHIRQIMRKFNKLCMKCVTNMTSKSLK